MAEKQKCACKQCDCDVNTKDAVEVKGRMYCSKPCSDGHKSEKGCGHPKCNC